MKMYSRSMKAAFTLVEMLTVIAITAILLALIIIPVVQGFNLTRNAQAFADAQDKARQVIERVGREVAGSAAILENSGVAGQIAVMVPSRNGTPVPILLDYAKLDILKPAEGEPLRGPSGAYINPDTGKEDPTLKAPKGQMVLPVAPGNTVIRYAIGLRDPLDARGYVNPYDGLLMQRSGQRDNLYVLFRFEVQPYVWDSANQRFVVDTRYFEVDPDTVVPGDPLSGKPILNDPFFLVPGLGRDGSVLTGAQLTAKAARIASWMQSGRLLTEVSRYDMIQPVFDKRSRNVVYDNDVPRILSLIQFRPAGVGNEPMEAMAAARLSTEGDGSDVFAPDVMRAGKGEWSNPVIRLRGASWNPAIPGSNEFLIGRKYTSGLSERFGVFLFDPDVNVSELSEGILLFDETTYDWAVGNNLTYPFSRSLNGAAMANSYNRSRFAAFDVDSRMGRLTASFGIDEVGDTGAAPPPGGNVPTVSTGLSLSPVQDPAPPGGLFDPNYSPSNLNYQINASFNKMWQVHPELRGGIHRFVDLRVIPQPDGTPSPLDPNPLRGFARAQIVPGSDAVIGPDQHPGPHFGLPVRYQRTTREPGPNQYRINYVDLAEPTNYRLLGFSDADASAFEGLGGAYSATNLISAMIQPRYKTGYVQFYSDPNLPLPAGNIQLTYRFQFSRSGDSFSADYDSRQLIDIKLTIRNYPQSNLPNPQGVTVATSAAAKNVLR